VPVGVFRGAHLAESRRWALHEGIWASCSFPDVLGVPVPTGLVVEGPLPFDPPGGGAPGASSVGSPSLENGSRPETSPRCCAWRAPASEPVTRSPEPFDAEGPLPLARDGPGDAAPCSSDPVYRGGWEGAERGGCIMYAWWGCAKGYGMMPPAAAIAA